tara:strand:- start:126628 stop:128085 length:1458 start_codon:yes stop_codon:yes gene_type:complete
MKELAQGENNFVIPPVDMSVERSHGSLTTWYVNLALFFAGLILNSLAYVSVLPVAAASFFFAIGWVLLLVIGWGGEWEKMIYLRVFLVGWVAIGIAGVYVEILLDQLQLYSDAGGFFDLVRGATSGQSIEEIRDFTEGALAVLFWREVYDFFATLGFPKERYIGVLVNVEAVSLSAVFALRMAQSIYGQDEQRFRRLILMFTWCGLYWLFAGIHLRDGLVLLVVVASMWIWLWYLKNPNLGIRLWALVGCSLMAGSTLTFLRTEFYFVPLALGVSGVTALIFRGDRQRMSLGSKLALLLGLLVVIAGIVWTWETLVGTLGRGAEAYLDLARTQSDPDSLGMALIVEQPLPIRLVLGTIYLYLFPIPFWSGFQLDSAYALFKSFNVLFFYVLIPLLVMSFVKLWKDPIQRTPAQLFLLFTTIGFSVAIAATSLESRHLGSFLVPVFLLALLPRLSEQKVRQAYFQLTIVFLLGIELGHFVWILLQA